MVIKSSPAPLAISEIVDEFGDAAGGSDSLSEYYRGGANVNDVATNSGVPESGAIDIGDFYGAGNAVVAAASAGNNIDVAPLFPGTYTNAVSKVLTIAAPIQITGTNVALTVPSNLAGTLDIQNAGNIIGSRGNGGNAGSGGVGGDASAGGAAISVQANGVTLNNSGTVSGGGGGGGGGGAGATNSSSNTVNFGAANYGNTRQWNQHYSGIPFQNNSALFGSPIGTVNWIGGAASTTQLNTSSGTGHPAQINRGNPLNDPQPTTPHIKRYNIGGGFYTQTTTTPGGNGGAGGNGYGWDGSSVVNAQAGASGSSPGGAAGGAGGAAGAAGTGGSSSPQFAGGSAGAGGNSLTSPGSVNYTVTNSGTINGTQG